MSTTVLEPNTFDLSAAEAFAAERRLIDEGWRSMETSTDFRLRAVSEADLGDEYTIIYVPGRLQLGKTSSQFFLKGRHEAPEEATYVEYYQATALGTALYWSPVD